MLLLTADLLVTALVMINVHYFALHIVIYTTTLMCDELKPSPKCGDLKHANFD